MIRLLHEQLGIPTEVLIQPYSLLESEFGMNNQKKEPTLDSSINQLVMEF